MINSNRPWLKRMTQYHTVLFSLLSELLLGFVFTLLFCPATLEIVTLNYYITIYVLSVLQINVLINSKLINKYIYIWLILAMVQYVIYCNICLNEYTMSE